MNSGNHFIFLLILIGYKAFSQQTINGFSMPESITSNGERFFISNQGQDVFSKDGDGFISEVSSDRKLTNLKVFPKQGVLNAPKGMAIAGNVLYVADLDRIVGFDIESGKTVFELAIPEAKVLNDICRLDIGHIAVTETVSGNIYKVNIKTKSSEIIGNVPTANGIAYNEKSDQLIICTNGKSYGDGSVYVKSGNEGFQELPNLAKGFFDGVEFVDDDHLLISDWVTFPVKGFGKLWLYDLKNQSAEFQFTEESAADIFYDHKTSEIWIPQMFQNKVVVYDKEQTFAKKHEKSNVLYNYGVIDAFIGGLYRGTLPLKELTLKGDFGIGAPDMLNGELTVLDGKAYQTKATGETVLLNNEHKTSFSSVTFFKPDTSFNIDALTDQKSLITYIESVLPHKNAMYAIKISGTFSYVKTRAFPPVKEEPFPALSTILDCQQLFGHRNTTGTFVGYHLPEYLNGIQASGLHLHFLSNDKKQGGHLLDFKGQNLKVEIATLKSFELEVPTNKAFGDFQFKKIHNEDLKRVEQGQ
jgi:alpha-acetolactate decarboxylase